MIEIARVYLENEMDLILANKQCMRLCELSGLSLSAQTTFATAVSEVSRSMLDHSNDATVVLNVSDKTEQEKYIIALICDKRSNVISNTHAGYTNARKPVSTIQLSPEDEEKTQVELRFRIPAGTRVSDVNIERWRIQLNNDPHVSPYEEIKRKNKQLLEIAEMLRKSEAQYKQLADTLPVLIFSLNDRGEVSYMNQWMSKFTGQTIEELNDTRWANTIHPEDTERAWRNWNSNVGDRANIHVEARLRDAATGEYYWHSGIVSPVKDENGNIVVWNAFLANVQALKDNAELIETQTAMQKVIEDLNNSNRQLEQFAYVASHDLQEPLRKIAFYSDILKRKYADLMTGDGTVYLDSMLRSADRMRQMVTDILTYSTISNKPVMTEVDLNDVVAEALQDLEIAINERGAKVHVDALPSLTGNAAQLKQLFENLLSNSLKFVAKDRPAEVSITAETFEGRLRIFFKDNGIGFEEQYLDRMFDLFQRLHTRDKFSGTGIGLTICKRIVDLHKGSITAKSHLGQGATFIIELPTTIPEPEMA